MTEPTTQAGKALLVFLQDAIAAIEAEAAATARAKAEVSDQAHAQLVADYDAALADAARLRNAVDAAVQNIAHDRVGAAVAGLRAALAANPDAEKWLAAVDGADGVYVTQKWLDQQMALSMAEKADAARLREALQLIALQAHGAGFRRIEKIADEAIAATARVDLLALENERVRQPVDNQPAEDE